MWRPCTLLGSGHRVPLEEGTVAVLPFRVDSFTLSRPELDNFDQNDAILLTARLWEEIGQRDRALATVRRLELTASTSTFAAKPSPAAAALTARVKAPAAPPMRGHHPSLPACAA
jgi:hypothetical protein